MHETVMGVIKPLIDDDAESDPMDVDKDELLRQAIVVLAGEKYAVEMQWKPIDFTAAMRWLEEHLHAFRKDEEEEGRSTLWYIG